MTLHGIEGSDKKEYKMIVFPQFTLLGQHDSKPHRKSTMVSIWIS